MIDSRLKYINNQLGLTFLTIKGATFNEESILFSVKKLDNFSQLEVLAHQQVILAHQQVILTFSSSRDLRKVVSSARRGWI